MALKFTSPIMDVFWWPDNEYPKRLRYERWNGGYFALGFAALEVRLFLYRSRSLFPHG